MQTVVQVICASGRSLCTLIRDEPQKLEIYSLAVVAEKNN